MSELTLINNASANVVSLDNIVPLKYQARFYVSYWGSQFADVLVNETSSTTVNSPSGSATMMATTMTSTPATTSVDLKNAQEASNVALLYASDGTIGFRTGSANGAVTANTLTLQNQCPFAVQFVLEPDQAPPQTWTVGPNSNLGIPLSEMFTAYAKVHGYPNEPASSGGYQTPAVAFSSPSATLTVWANNSKGESYHIQVT